MSASGFSWPTASTRRAGRQPLDDDRRDGPEPGDEVDHFGAARAARAARRSRQRPAGPLEPLLTGRLVGRRATVALGPGQLVGGQRPWRRQRLAVGQVVRRGVAGLQLVEQMQDPRSALQRLVELEMELRDPLQPQALAELVPDERHLPAHRR